uniref:Pseudouridine synthase RsuA/RluA-like domain-containing protein n=1 Tax=Peronospora matthiolae TaxID=2874970 RepID=A0AAV1U9D5_9STRA
MVDDALPPSKKLRRKQEKAQWLADRKASQLATGSRKSSRKRRNQRQSHSSATIELVPIVHCQSCSSTKCTHRLAGITCVVRSINPYVHRFALFVKGRWVGSSVGEVFTREFPTLSATYCARAVQLGLVRVNGSEASLDLVLKSGDFFEHWKHRHEPSIHCPVVKGRGQKLETKRTTTSLSSTWVHCETNEVMVVDKPSGIPVHPTGSYHFNSLVQILQHERRKATQGEIEVETLELFPVHRLDRLTSGLLLLAKSVEKARSLSAELTATSSVEGLESRLVQKYYVARVTGEFPQVEATSTWAHVEGVSSGLVKIEAVEDGYWRVTAPIGLETPRQGHVRCVTEAPGAKSCVTLIRLHGKAVNGQSIVECRLVTGRTHQIRVHLQHLGFPVANDPLYGRELIENSRIETFDYRAGTVGVAVQVMANGYETSNTGTEPPVEGEDRDEEERCICACDICIGAMQEKQLGEVEETDVLWLHSYRYESPSWSYEVPLPRWAYLHEGEHEIEYRKEAL